MCWDSRQHNLLYFKDDLMTNMLFPPHKLQVDWLIIIGIFVLGWAMASFF